MTEMAIIDGRICELSEAKIPVLDLGFQRGLGVFETVRTYGGHPFALGAHLERLWEGAAALGIAPFFLPGVLRAQLAEALALSGATEARIHLIITPGDHREGLFGAHAPRLVVLVRALSAPPPSIYTDGIDVVCFSAQRLLPSLKTTSYLVGLRGMALAQAAGAREALYLDADGHVTEGVTSNLLALRDGVVLSPIGEALAGITRATLAELVPGLGLGWADASLTPHDLQRCDEVWICSSVRELVPVVGVDGVPVGDGRPGPWAARLLRALRQASLRAAKADAS